MADKNNTTKAMLSFELEVVREERDGYKCALKHHKAALCTAQEDVVRLRRERDEARKALLDQANAMGLMARNWPVTAVLAATDKPLSA